MLLKIDPCNFHYTNKKKIDTTLSKSSPKSFPHLLYTKHEAIIFSKISDCNFRHLGFLKKNALKNKYVKLKNGQYHFGTVEGDRFPCLILSLLE